LTDGTTHVLPRHFSCRGHAPLSGWEILHPFQDERNLRVYLARTSGEI